MEKLGHCSANINKTYHFFFFFQKKEYEYKSQGHIQITIKSQWQPAVSTGDVLVKCVNQKYERLN